MRKKLRSHKKWRWPLVRWHRRIGITASLLVVWLSVTGIVLNHSDHLRLQERPVGQSLLFALYGIKPPTVASFYTGEHWVSHLGANHVYLDEKEVAYCTPPFSGAVLHGELYVVGCGDGLLLLTLQGEVLERLGAVYGFPSPVMALATQDGLLLLKTAQGVISVNLDKLDWQAYRGEVEAVQWGLTKPPPESLVGELLEYSAGGQLNWQRVVLDLHNGRLAGWLGVWLLDASAFFLIILALSGLSIWATSRTR